MGCSNVAYFFYKEFFSKQIFFYSKVNVIVIPFMYQLHFVGALRVPGQRGFGQPLWTLGLFSIPP